ncbi:histidine phosphatase family protein [Candidatus Woesearchaeota archaeon]|nr:histidine phosphatase family protein [Candidatus Woesearchaeota archaeon]
MRLILTRHGETEENKKDISQGHIPGKLSADGKKQAEKVALRLKNEKLDCIYSSDLARAIDTARFIAKHHKKTPLIITKDLRETDLRKWSGKVIPFDIRTEANRKRFYGQIESRASMRRRAKKALDKAYKKYPDGCVLFVGHAGINKALISVIMKKPVSFMSKLKQHNTAVNIFEIREDGKHKIHLLNCKKHLE